MIHRRRWLGIAFIFGLAIWVWISGVKDSTPPVRQAEEMKIGEASASSSESLTTHQAAAVPPETQSESVEGGTEPQYIQDLKQETGFVFESLPTFQVFRKQKDAAIAAKEYHYTPEEIRVAASRIGELVEKYQERSNQDPLVKKELISFYSRCSGATDVVTAMRALCYHHQKKLDPEGSEDAHVSSQIKELAQWIDDL